MLCISRSWLEKQARSSVPWQSTDNLHPSAHTWPSFSGSYTSFVHFLLLDDSPLFPLGLIFHYGILQHVKRKQRSKLLGREKLFSWLSSLKWKKGTRISSTVKFSPNSAHIVLNRVQCTLINIALVKKFTCFFFP